MKNFQRMIAGTLINLVLIDIFASFIHLDLLWFTGELDARRWAIAFFIVMEVIAFGIIYGTSDYPTKK